jgi:hypothetical protein
LQGTHSSLIRTVICGKKKFYNIGPWDLYHKTLTIHNLRFRDNLGLFYCQSQSTLA